jgi:predicted nucleic acid-binding protein
MELADSSAWIRVMRVGGAHRVELEAAVAAGRIATCDVVVLEVLRGARNAGELDELREGFDDLPHCPVTSLAFRRALWVQAQLARRRGGQHRVPPSDLLVAAAAEARGIAVVHHDRHFDAIAAVTGQAVRRI